MKKFISVILLSLFLSCSCVLSACGEGEPIKSITYQTTDGKTNTVFSEYSHLITGIKIKNATNNKLLLDVAHSKYSNYINNYYYIVGGYIETGKVTLDLNPFDTDFGMRLGASNGSFYSFAYNCPVYTELTVSFAKFYNLKIKNEGNMSRITYYKSPVGASKTMEPKKQTISVPSSSVNINYL